ncbi:MAG TPA: SUMF1/EgtB/PvdO family nonheme iron enzyme, partial [Promineifilum sp.]|nr:SUMF1/EgtB/PvdO family nonheme iron enzyme [Promineifilum sp.]
LYSLRRALATHENWGPLITYTDSEVVRLQLRQATTSLAHIEANLRALLAVFGVTDRDEESALRDYLEHVLRETAAISFLFVKPAGPRHKLKTEAELEAVYVPLQVQDPDRPAEQARAQNRRAPKLAADDLEPAEARTPTLTIDQVLARHAIFLLRGKPGSGKTTLLRHLAHTFAAGQAAERLAWTGEPLLPILVPLRNFGRFLDDHRKEYASPAPLALRNFIEDYFKGHELGLPPDFFHRRLDQGHCLVLLDGLDEVADKPLRATVAQYVSSFLKHYEPKGNRFGLSSREKGYDEVAAYLPRPIVCNVQDLEPDGRDHLVRNLLQQFDDDPRRCREETADLLHDIANRRQVDSLSRNPLFCTTLVLVYKYRGRKLPERRVDVYQEVVSLMLGFWETQRTGVAEARELALMDGTGRSFMDEFEAIEVKQRTLTDLADWMQQEAREAGVQKEEVLAHLATFFSEREGAQADQKSDWARGFLDVAHQRSGLFIEIDPGVYAFSHGHFREYLAATALVDRTDDEMVRAVLAHAAEGWWEEVIKLAVAHERLSPSRRELLLRAMIDGGHLVLAGWCAVDAGSGRLPAPLRERIKSELRARMVDGKRLPPDRFAAGEALDALGWLPEDLNGWVRCPASADDRRDLLAGRYPVTNAQYELFLRAGGYDDPAYWGGEQSEGWQWRTGGERPVSSGKNRDEPEYWQSANFGRDRRGFPVVGVCWYEAAAYCGWLTALLRRARAGEELPPAHLALIAGLVDAGAAEARFPSEREWVRLAGGEADDRYPWDGPAGATTDKATILARANTSESAINNTSPVAMYPQGSSRPFGLQDMAGNVWEWTASWVDEKQSGRVLRGGSWHYHQRYARASIRHDNTPVVAFNNSGFRPVAPVDSGN